MSDSRYEGELIARLYPCSGTNDTTLVNKVLKQNPAFYPKRWRSECAGFSPTLPSYLEFRFSKIPRTSQGFVFGTARATCDVLLPSGVGLSVHHCALTFASNFDDTQNYRLVLRDLGSTRGTAVQYDGEGGLVHKDFRWILGGHGVPKSRNPIVIRFLPRLEFRVEVAYHNIEDDSYAEKVERLLQGSGKPEDILMGLQLRTNPATIRATDVHTPSSRPIRLCVEELGRGVAKVWDVSTGGYYVERVAADTMEEFEAGKEQLVSLMSTLRRVQHKRIIRFVAWDEFTLGHCMLVTEFCRDGNLFHMSDKQNLIDDDYDARRKFTDTDIIQVLHQVAEALAHLHRRGVVHGSLDPSGVLFRSRRPLDVVLNNVGKPPAPPGRGRPHCLAPELVAGGADPVADPKIAKAADVWALGALAVCMVLHGLPMMWMKSGNSGGDATSYPTYLHEEVLAMLEMDPMDKLILAILPMLALDPRSRPSAGECLARLEGLLPEGDWSGPPVDGEGKQSLGPAIRKRKATRCGDQPGKKSRLERVEEVVEEMVKENDGGFSESEMERELEELYAMEAG